MFLEMAPALALHLATAAGIINDLPRQPGHRP